MTNLQSTPRAISRVFSYTSIICLLCFTSLSLANSTNSKVITDDASTLHTVSPDLVDHNKTTYEGGGGNNDHEIRSEGLVVAAWHYHEIRDPLIFTIVLVLAGVCKIVYHHAGFLSSKVPESCILIILGVLFGTLIFITNAQETLPTFFKPHEFFVFLLPPIILEAAFSLHDRAFIENLGSILLFAVVGTVLACGFVGFSLYGLAQSGAMGSIQELGLLELLVFSSLIVAVDPVAVLAVFNEIGVNHVLYFLVFGESLLNDGVTVVLYKVFQSYNVMDEITAVHYVLGVVKFLVVCLGGLLLGVLAGVASALLTKQATHVKVAQPLIVYMVAYLGFLCAELFEFSGIICIVGCGITQKHYAFHNISDKSKTTISYFTKVISTACETIIFMFLGLSMVNDNLEWHTGFTLWTIIACNVYRFMITFGLSFLINKFDTGRVRKITLDEQFMIAYGGLRGAVCFSLVAMLSPVEFPAKKMFVTSTLVVILFTVFVQGVTIKPLVKLLQIKLAPEKQKSMYKELHEHVADHVMAGMEDIIGNHGKNHLMEKMKYLDAQYLQPLLLTAPDPCDAQLKKFYEHLVLKEHYNHMKASNAKEMEQTPELPHITTELFLKGLLSPSDLEGIGNGGGDDDGARIMDRIPTITVDEPQQPSFTGDASFNSTDDQITLRKRIMKSRSLSRERGPATSSNRVSLQSVTNANQLRNLLRQNTSSRVAHYDRNLTQVTDFQSHIKKKSAQNQRLLRMSSIENNVSPRLAAQLSWCEADSEATAQRRISPTKENGSGRRHAASVDLQNHERRATVNIVSSGDTAAAFSPRLDSVHEVNEENASKNRTSPLSSSASSNDDDDDGLDDESQPMIEGEGSEERKIRLMKRKGRRSTKHKLERQGGLDKQASDPGEADGRGRGQQSSVSTKDLDEAGQGNGDHVVKVDADDGVVGAGGDAAKVGLFYNLNYVERT